MGAVEREVTFERGSNARFIAFPGTDDRNEVSRIEDTDPVEIEGGYDKISGQLANVCGRDDRLGVSFRLAALGNCFLLTAMRILPSRIPSAGE
jgi:hypothetical protein